MICHMKRTTLMLDDHRWVELKRLAAERKQTVSAVVDEFLGQGLARAKAPQRRGPRKPLPSFDMGLPRVNVADRDQLYQWMEGT